jgi:hypothetical protein
MEEDRSEVLDVSDSDDEDVSVIASHQLQVRLDTSSLKG